MESYILQISQAIEDNYKKYLDKDFDNIQDLDFIKDLPYDKKLNAIKLVLSNKHVVDNTSIFNINLLIMGLQIIDQKELQSNSKIWANNLKEFADLAIDLRSEIDNLARQLFYCFIGILKTFRTHLNEGLKIEELSATDSLLLESLSFLGMGNIIKKVRDTINLEDIPYYIHGEGSLHVMCNQFNILNILTENLKI